MSPFALAFRANAGLERVDPRTWRTALLARLAHTNEGLVILDDRFEILFSTAHAVHLFRRLGSADTLPPSVRALLEEQVASREPHRSLRLAGVGPGPAVFVHASLLPDALPAIAALWLREEILRDEGLYVSLRDRFGLSRRQFQLARLLSKGLSNKEISKELRLSEATVKSYLHELYRACGVTSRTAVVALVNADSESKSGLP